MIRKKICLGVYSAVVVTIEAMKYVHSEIEIRLGIVGQTDERNLQKKLRESF
jgi:hypothetical protein